MCTIMHAKEDTLYQCIVRLWIRAYVPVIDYKRNEIIIYGRLDSEEETLKIYQQWN